MGHLVKRTKKAGVLVTLFDLRCVYLLWIIHGFSTLL